MIDTIERRGIFWWLKDSDSGPDGVTGALTVSRDGQIKLKLDGALSFDDGSTFPSFFKIGLHAHEKIAGRLDLTNDSDHVLLSGLTMTVLPFEDPKQEFEAIYCLKRLARFPSDYTERFFQVRLGLKGLEEWLRIDSLRVERAPSTEEQESFTVSYRDRHDRWQSDLGLVELSSFTSGLNWFNLFSSDGVRRDLTIERTDDLIVDFITDKDVPQSIDAFDSLSFLLALLVGEFTQRSWPIALQKGAELDEWHTIYYRRPVVEKEEISSYETWSSYNDVRDSIGTLLSGVARFRDQHSVSANLFASSRQLGSPMLEHEFVTRIWCLEGLHRSSSSPSPSGEEKISLCLGRFDPLTDKDLRRWLKGKLRHAAEPTLEERLFEMFTALPLAVDRKAMRRFALRCASRRNDISHRGGPPSSESYVDFIDDISKLDNALAHLTHAVLLQQVGVDQESLRAMLSDSAAGRFALKRTFVDAELIPSS